MKKILQTLGILLTVLICFGLLYFEELLDFQALQSAGYVSVEPVSIWVSKTENEPVYVSDYRIRFELETESGWKYFDLSIEQAYDTGNYDKVLKSYKKKKPVEGYVYYSENSENAYFSRTAKSDKELIKERLQSGCLFAICVGLLFILPIWMPLLMKVLKLTKLPEGYPKSADDIVCTYQGYTWCLLMLLGAMMLVLTLVIAIMIGFADGEVAIGLVFLLLSACFGGVVAYFALMMKNWMFIIYPDGILYRTATNKLFQYRTEDILRYNIIRSYRNRSLAIQMKDRRIGLNNHCNNYYEAEAWVKAHVK